MATERDYYTILGVPRTASDGDVKRAFRKLAQQWHPDVNRDSGADERFKEINEAYQVLSDPQRRQAYDLFGHAGTNAGADGFGPFGGVHGFGDLFDAFFGGAGAGTATRHGRPPPGADLRYDLRLTFAESISGAEKEIEFTARARCDACSGSGAAAGTSPTTCSTCGGSGEVRTVRSTMLGQMVSVAPCARCAGMGRTIETPCPTCRGDGRTERRRKLRVAIPAGIDDGHQVRLSGEGEAGPRGGPAGNLYVVAHVAAHPRLKRQDAELYLDLPISLAQAALGAKVTVPTADGEEAIEIKPGTQPGTEIRLRGRGVPHLRRPGARGDLHVMIEVAVPTKLTKRQRELLVEFAAESGESVHDRPEKGLLDKVKDAIS
jgi:molecular chaperone DnaJ